MSPLTTFRNIFPDIFPANRLIETDDELRYLVDCDSCASAYEYFARRLILSKGLSLVADREVRSSKRFRQLSVVIRVVPEMSCADECQDGEGLDGGFWGYREEE